MSDTAVSGQLGEAGDLDSEDAEKTINLYDTLSLPKDASTADIQKQLRILKRDWGSRAARSGSMGDKARSQLEFVALAEPHFASDDAREQYDLSLHRQLAEPAQEQEIDWLTRAWNYYYLADEGAAAVAARKAKEQHPNDQMVYVVSAWVKLMGGSLDKDDVKRAKEDADEAFVLDELGEDTVDVHHVRAVVFLGLDDYNRGMQSIDRALAKATADEKPQLYYVKGALHMGLREYDQMLSATIDGLEASENILPAEQDRLTDNLLTALTPLCWFQQDPARTINACTTRSANIRRCNIPGQPKNRAIALLDQFSKMASLEKISDATGSKPGLPLKMIGFGLLVLLVGAAMKPPLAAAGVIILAIAGFIIYRGSAWEKQRTAYNKAQSQLQSLQASLPRPVSTVAALESSRAQSAH